MNASQFLPGRLPMKLIFPLFWKAILGSSILAYFSVCELSGQFVAFNDHSPGVIGLTTHSNATTWNIFGNPPGAAGALKDIRTGIVLPVKVAISTSGGVSPASSAANPDPGTPLYDTFHGYVDFQGLGNADAVAHVPAGASVTYMFSGLDPARTYNFKGSAVRGASGGTYPQRWSLFEIDGPRSLASAHTAGCYTNGLASNQVAINTGQNTSGDMADWENIVPAADGTFAVVTTQYTGLIPGGGLANGPYTYALDGFRLEEFSPPASITSSIGIQSATNFWNHVVQVVFSAPVQTASATNLANYSLATSIGNVPIFGATIGADGQTIQLVTASQLPYALHALTVSRVADAATGTQVIPPNTQIVFTNVAFSTGYIRRQLYLNIGGSTAVSALTSNAKFPNNPDKVDYPSSMGWPQANIADNYGGRFAGFLVPPISGVYFFAVRSDDSSQLFLGSGEAASLKRLLIAEPGCCEGFDARVSTAVTLTAAQHYYIEALMKEGGGGDYLYVAWKTPTNHTWTVIPGSNLGNYFDAPNSTLSIQQQPVKTIAIASQTAWFSVIADGKSTITTNLTYQWQLNGLDIAGCKRRLKSAAGGARKVLHLPGQRELLSGFQVKSRVFASR